MRRTMILWVLCVLLFPAAFVHGQSDQGPAGAADSPESRAIQEARALLRDGHANRAIRLLELNLTQNPYHFGMEVMLAKALLAKCETRGRIRSAEHKALVRRPYDIGQKLNKIDPSHPEPFFLVGKALLLYGRPAKAGKMAKKAIHFARGDHPEIAAYWMLLGDAYREKKVYTKAKKAYENGQYEAATRNQHRLFDKFKWRLASLKRALDPD